MRSTLPCTRMPISATLAMKLYQVVAVVEAKSVPAALGDYPKGSLLLKYVEDEPEITKPLALDDVSAYWNSKEWTIVDAGGICSERDRLVNWLVIAEPRKLD